MFYPQKHSSVTFLGRFNIVSELNRCSVSILAFWHEMLFHAIQTQNVSPPIMNIELLIQDLAEKCQLLYTTSSQAVTRTAHLNPKLSTPLAGDYVSQTSNMRKELSIYREYHESQVCFFLWEDTFHNDNIE